MNLDKRESKLRCKSKRHSFLDPFGKGGNRKGGNEKHFQMKGGNGGNVFFLYSKKQRFGDPFYRWPAAGGFFLISLPLFHFSFDLGRFKSHLRKTAALSLGGTVGIRRVGMGLDPARRVGIPAIPTL